MTVIGITGGVGAGKSQLLSYIEKHYSCRILLADDVAKKVQEKGQRGYYDIVNLLSKDILKEDGSIDTAKMAEKIFSSPPLLRQVNDFIHPAVKEFILQAIEEERKSAVHDFLLIEAALLIEGGYLEIVDEMWYIYAKESVRRERLRSARSYSDEKIDAIMKNQLTEERFRTYCRVVIDNSHALSEAYRQIDERLGEVLQRSVV